MALFVEVLHFFSTLGLFLSRRLSHFHRLSLSDNSEQIRQFQHSQFQSRESDKMSIQGMIETNKKWLEDFKRDSKVYPLPEFGL